MSISSEFKYLNPDQVGQLIESYVTTYPETSAQLLGAVAKGLATYEASIQSQRSQQMMAMLEFVIDSKTYKKSPGLRIFPLVFMWFPDGYPKGGSTNMINLWETFLTACKLQPVKESWILSFWGKDAMIWANAHMTEDMIVRDEH